MIAGIDLSGPSNHKDTACALIEGNEIEIYSNLSDSNLFSLLEEKKVTHIGLDAPLSYSETGGYRESDRELRELLNNRGFKTIGVMAPTFNRMIYLTARGIRLTRLFQNLAECKEIFEAHPGAFYVLDGYSYELVTTVKSSLESIEKITEEVVRRGFSLKMKPQSDHDIMSVGTALAVKAKLENKHHWELKDSSIDSYYFIA